MKKILVVGANGYIGSALCDLLRPAFDVVGVDNYLRPAEDTNAEWIHQSGRKLNSEWSLVETSYQNLDLPFLDEFSDCVWLAGHSSVLQAKNDEYAALNNNLHDLIKFRQRFRGRFIYASSGSVYSRPGHEICGESARLTSPQNIYDYTKTAFDHYIEATHTPVVGLRFGTVNGGGRRIRPELMLNSMCRSAKHNGVVRVSNEGIWRPVLYLQDLIRGIEAVLHSDVDQGIFNMCSVNGTIGDYAEAVARFYGATVEHCPPSPTYNFSMTAEKFQTTFGYSFVDSVDEIIRNIDSWLA